MGVCIQVGLHIVSHWFSFSHDLYFVSVSQWHSDLTTGSEARRYLRCFSRVKITFMVTYRGWFMPGVELKPALKSSWRIQVCSSILRGLFEGNLSQSPKWSQWDVWPSPAAFLHCLHVYVWHLYILLRLSDFSVLHMWISPSLLAHFKISTCTSEQEFHQWPLLSF